MPSTSATIATPSSDTGFHGTVKLYALSAGHLTLPETHFVHPASETARSTVPSLAFLIQHENPDTQRKTNILFDLGLRKDPTRYSEPIQKHAATRQPLMTKPDVVESLAAGNIHPDDIDFVIYSHVHWDHVGEPRDFPLSTFVVGHGAVDLLQDKAEGLRGSHSFFEADLLPSSRTLELSSPAEGRRELSYTSQPGKPDFGQPWTSLDGLPHTMDIFQDGSIYVVDAPGHLPGHINLLCRIGVGGSVYLAGDACHDRRIMRREKIIGEWKDSEGHTCCIHADRAQAEQTIGRIRELEGQGVEVIFAHDVEWEQNPMNNGRFFGAR